MKVRGSILRDTRPIRKEREGGRLPPWMIQSKNHRWGAMDHLPIEEFHHKLTLANLISVDRPAENTAAIWARHLVPAIMPFTNTGGVPST